MRLEDVEELDELYYKLVEIFNRNLTRYEKIIDRASILIKLYNLILETETLGNSELPPPN